MRNRTRCLLVVAVATACSPGKDERPTSSDGVADSNVVETGEISESATAGAGDETSGAETTTTTGSFVPDMPEVTEAVCDPWAQDCPEGEKCVAYSDNGEPSWNANKCVPVLGDGAHGDSCTASASIVEATDDCGADSFCWNVMDVGGEGIGVCTPFCQGSADEAICEPGSSCLISNEGAINLCIPICDPLLQDCVGAGMGCYWAGDNFNCIGSAFEVFQTGEPCGYINDCAPGNVCLAPEAFPACAGASCCGQYCDLANPEVICEPMGTECVAFFEEGEVIPGYENVGVCVLPE
jgi:hypothetical protein